MSKRISLTALSCESEPFSQATALTHFTQVLPETVRLNPLNQPHICIKRVTISNTVIKDQTLGYIKVHLQELNPVIGAREGDLHCLAHIPLSSVNLDELYSLNFAVYHPIFQPFSNITELRTLTFSITDPYNQVLESVNVEATPTVIECELVEMYENFSITLSSDACADIYPNNTDMEFKTYFRSPFDLGPKWEVALHSIILPSGVFVDGTYFIWIKRNGRTYRKSWSRTLRKDSDSERESIRKSVNEWLNKHHLNIRLFDKKVLIKSYTYRWIEVVLNENMCMLFGLENRPRGINASMSPKATYTLGEYKKDAAIKLTESIAVCCDLVENSIVGKNKAQLIDIVSSQSMGLFRGNKDNFYYSKHLAFKPIQKRSFNTIYLYLRDVKGNRINYKKEESSKNSYIQYTLIFRQASQ